MSSHTYYTVGDQYYLQAGGGAIGLELIGAVSRAFLAKWDRIYLQKVKKGGISMYVCLWEVMLMTATSWQMPNTV